MACSALLVQVVSQQSPLYPEHAIAADVPGTVDAGLGECLHGLFAVQPAGVWSGSDRDPLSLTQGDSTRPGRAMEQASYRTEFCAALGGYDDGGKLWRMKAGRWVWVRVGISVNER
jgi:hypothetical protein